MAMRVRRWVSLTAFVAAAIVAGAVVWVTSSENAPAHDSGPCAGIVTTAALPTWARSGFTPAGFHTPHVISDHDQIIAVLFGPLRVHQRAGARNKVLWSAKAGASPLHIRAHLVGTSRTVTKQLADIGPSYLNMPAPGCWRMSLRWSPHHDTIALRYRP